jgi:hypothetical protein
LRGEIAQGFLTVSYAQRQVRYDTLGQRPLTKMFLTQLLWAPKISVKRPIYLLDRDQHAVILSEALDEKAINILVDLAFQRIFPEQCDMWRIIKEDIREKFKKEVTVRTEAVHQDLVYEENSLRALREWVVDDVMKLFP